MVVLHLLNDDIPAFFSNFHVAVCVFVFVTAWSRASNRSEGFWITWKRKNIPIQYSSKLLQNTFLFRSFQTSWLSLSNWGIFCEKIITKWVLQILHSIYSKSCYADLYVEKILRIQNHPSFQQLTMSMHFVL